MGQNRRTRALVLLATITMLMATMLAPAHATAGDDDIETVRSEVAGTFTYKIGLLADKKAQTENPDRAAAYQAGITELTAVRDSQVPNATTIEELWALNDLAHSIYHEAVAAADAIPPTPAEELAWAKEAATSTITNKIKKLRQWIEGCDDPDAIGIVNAGISQLEGLYLLVEAAQTADDAYAVKQQAKNIYNETKSAAETVKDDGKNEEPEPKVEEEKTEEQKAAEALARARRATLALLDDKATLLRTAAEAESIPAIVKVFENAAADIDALVDDAKAADTKAELTSIEEQALAIYRAAKEAAMAIRNSEEGDPAEALSAYLQRVVDYVNTTTRDAEPTAEQSPDTFGALVDARDRVLDRVERVAAVAETGDGLGERWEDLNDSLTDYRLALIRHYIALVEPITIGGINIPG